MEVQMLVVKGKQRGHTIRFPVGEYLFGRGPECQVRPNSDMVSRQHCLLCVGHAGVHIRDLGSRNGTLVNGARVVGELRLAPGDQLQLGPVVLQVNFIEPPPGAACRDTEEVRALDTQAEMLRIVPEEEYAPTESRIIDT